MKYQTTKSVDSIHYYNNIIVIEKRPITKPFYYHTGKTTVKNYNPPKDLFKRVIRKLKTIFNNLIIKK
ncbi:MAG: hypothetical protein U5K55_01375 [Aliarcobacter sp.]|nr:hypothetical protein [Aliarcobacter sp.]